MSQQVADVIISSNTVFTGLSDQPEPASIAIKDNKIVAIGTEEEIKHCAGEHTKIYQFKDQLIMPGFHDFHLHIMQGAVALNSVNLFAARSEDEALKMIGEFAESKPENQWVIGFTWDAGYWDIQQLPTRHSLDHILPNRPALMFHAEGHYAWVNTKALEIANITRHSENPFYGIIGKDENGEPNGILYEKAMDAVIRHAFNFSNSQKNEIFSNFLAHAASLGVTAVNDLHGLKTIESLDVFKEFEDNGKLTTRIHLWPALNGDLGHSKQLRETYQSDKLRVSGLKQFIDGVITARTAYLLEPYADQPETRGETSFPPETIKKWVVAADKEGFSIRFHAIGDGAIRLALDAYEEAQKTNGKRDSRHSVEHIEVIHPDDIHRFSELGVMVSMQPDHLAMSERGVYTEQVGAEREKYVFSINTLQKTGAKLAFGTDFPIDILNPLLQIYRAVTRIDSSGKTVWHPHECITLAEALKAYTSGPAYGTFREQELGTLEAGKLADIIVLERNPFEVLVEEIPDIKVLLTMVDGQVVYDYAGSLV
ncbi:MULTISPECIES: amidohydrolase [unclassified Bacillus (in: firmicutes)]|uniref:amidohydrolase n=1 Tax=unclassified Bacillus (in: firmicutes) TaxID=185979 RepID=UPI001BEBA9F4|nr:MULTISPECIES: amidohydrolase [unclassified Bacillus (in: firmicutes)]MBT2616052.1 amidohydrolase [Bacillus sp. ISL-78]MBT2630195.1 amidohydrolase [Bacillus sp. ISL-101]MBT2714641.1 amidohydrolase [Bacillus sp. ISL-57]